jgi:hypothetical protein
LKEVPRLGALLMRVLERGALFGLGGWDEGARVFRDKRPWNRPCPETDLSGASRSLVSAASGEFMTMGSSGCGGEVAAG